MGIWVISHVFDILFILLLLDLLIFVFAFKDDIANLFKKIIKKYKKEDK